jgi:aryl-alcohol dehydrogenase-like predicted oxidoreductase
MKRIIDNGVSIVSNQVSYSIIDRRPENEMVSFCQQRNIKLLAYGTLLGGLLSKKWIGKPEPVGKPQLSTASLIKYKRFVDKWGSWELFQELLQTLNGVAEKHNVGIANVAMSVFSLLAYSHNYMTYRSFDLRRKFILDKPAVGAVIVGIRPGYSDHIEDNIKSFSLSLNANDIQLIEAVIAKGNRLAGEPGDEYRYQ